jgi:hypothetical protein
MFPMRVLRACLIALVAVLGLPAQTVLGSLLYSDPVGRGIHLTVVDGGAPDRMTLQPELGVEGRFRKTVLILAGPERFQNTPVQVLVEKAPGAWKVEGRSGGSLVRAANITFWRYLPGQVLPARFLFDGKLWVLSSADVPARKFPGMP